MPLIPLAASTGTGVRYDLAPDADVSIAAGVLIKSTANDAIFGMSAGNSVTVAGKVSAAWHGISLGDDYKGDLGCVIDVKAGGSVWGAGQSAIMFVAADFTLTNAGVIKGATYGLGFISAGDGVDLVKNAGTITGTLAAIARLGNGLSTETLKLVNTGTLSGEWNYQGGEAVARDIVINRGEMLGLKTDLGAGNDLFDNRGGTVNGVVYGGLGDDVFRPGAGAKTFEGGEGRDTVDYRSGGGVTLSLANARTAKGAAAGNVFENIEVALGSKTGNDRLFGSTQSDTLVGNGGKDILSGGEGEDLLIGGAGKDRIIAGEGVDTVIGGKGIDVIDLSTSSNGWAWVHFDALNECGDKILGFENSDEIMLKGSAFGGGLTPDAWDLDDARFHSGTTNKAADLGDRIIFRTTDATVWFDRDGTGGKYDAVLIADLDDGTGFLAHNITFI